MQAQSSKRKPGLQIQKGIIYIVIGLLYIIAILTVMEVIYNLYLDIITPPVLFIEINDILDVLGMFLLVLVVLELLETVNAYLDENIVHVEVVLEAAMIAVARKMIILDVKETAPAAIFGIGFLLVALAAGYFAAKHFQADRTH